MRLPCRVCDREPAERHSDIFASRNRIVVFKDVIKPSRNLFDARPDRGPPGNQQ